MVQPPRVVEEPVRTQKFGILSGKDHLFCAISSFYGFLRAWYVPGMKGDSVKRLPELAFRVREERLRTEKKESRAARSKRVSDICVVILAACAAINVNGERVYTPFGTC
jgi:hypothetical protein